MNVQEYIKTELLAVVPALYVLGIKLKKSKIPDKKIPCILGIVAVVLSALWVIATTEISGLPQAASALFTAITQGILVAGASVYANQLYRQAKKED